MKKSGFSTLSFGDHEMHNLAAELKSKSPSDAEVFSARWDLLGVHPGKHSIMETPEKQNSGIGLRINPNRAKTPVLGYSIDTELAKTVKYAKVSANQESSLSQMSSIEENANSEGYKSSEDDTWKNSEASPLLTNFKRRRSYGPETSTENSNKYGALKDGESYSDADSLLSSVSDAFRSFSPELFSKRKILNTVKVAILFIVTVVFTVMWVAFPEEEFIWHQVSVNMEAPYFLYCGDEGGKESPVVKIELIGPIMALPSVNYTDVVSFDLFSNESHRTEWVVGVNKTDLRLGKTVKLERTFDKGITLDPEVLIKTTSNESVALSVRFHFLSAGVHHQILFAALILVSVYTLIIFDLVHRTLAAIIGSLVAIATLAALNERPSMEQIVAWIDLETVLLLFGMMIIVSIFSETGFFDYCALQAYKLAKGKMWTLITLLCVFSGVVSAFLDNVTTILLLTPLTIRLCEVLNLNPKHILIAEVIFSNIGGTATAIGDPPNVLIVANEELAAEGINFAEFTIHMTVGILFVSVVSYGFLRLLYRKKSGLLNKDPHEITEMKHEIEMWKRAASRISVASREESVMKALFVQKALQIENNLTRQLYRNLKTKQKDYETNLKELEKQYCITDKPLLIKCSIVLVITILTFFMSSFVSGLHMDLGGIALLGAIWLLVLADITDLENILHRVEWATLIFFAALFTLMEALQELELIKWIGDSVSDMIKDVPPDDRLLAAIVIIVWISAIASSFIDNIPFTTAMIPILLQLHKDPTLGLPLLPLTFALAFGACLGGNGTLIGASANVVCAGIAEQHGYGFTFTEFMKIGFPMMLVSNVVATIYLIICHIAIGWH